MIGIQIGAMLLVLARQNRDAGRARSGGSGSPSLYAAGVVLLMVADL